MNVRQIRTDARAALGNDRRGALLDTLLCCCLPTLAALSVNLLYFALDRAVAGRTGGIGASSLRTAYHAANAALYILSTAVSLGSVLLAFLFKALLLRRARAQAVSGRDRHLSLRLVWRVLLLAILSGVYIALWSCLLVVPGIIAAYRYRFAPFLLADHPDYLPSQALRESCRMTRGRKAGLFRLDLSFLYYYVPLALAETLMNVGTLTTLFETYGVPFPALSYEQMLALYAAGACLSVLACCLFAAHAMAASATAYDRTPVAGPEPGPEKFV